MKSVGRRSMPTPSLRPSAEQLRAAYAVNDPLRALLPGGRIAAPKGIYRWRTLEEANRQQDAWLAEAMAQAGAARRK
ncbi:MAG: hypothetical protein ACT4P3_06820 [Betaproteobacteria bacterium]